MPFSTKLQTILPFWIYCTLLTWWVSDHPFFWDTVQLASKHGHWYYDQQFQHFFLPESINSGHPPLFGMYIAFCWLLFGKSLVVSHFSMLPFLFGIVWQLYKIGGYFGEKSTAKYLIILVLIDPFFAGQSVLVSPDLVLVFAFLLSLNGILQQQKWSILIGTILLGLISMRGMMVAFALYLWWVGQSVFEQQEVKITFENIIYTALKKLPFFLPAGLLSLTFLVCHYAEFGWIGYHPNSPWAPSFERVGMAGFEKNIGLLGWRFLDFGRVFLWVGLACLCFKIVKNQRLNGAFKNFFQYQLFTLFILFFLILTPSLLLHKGLMSHRYLLPLTLTLTFLFYYLLCQVLSEKRQQKIIYGIALLGLLTGNLWVYPKQIAQGWDATLAHLPYYKTRQQMIDYIDKQKIPYAEIGTVFPNIGPFEWYDLNERTDGFVKKDFSKNKYFLYSVVFNNVTDEELAILENDWTIVQEFESFGLEMILYKK